MRPTTTQSRNLSLKSNIKSMTTLHQLKKTTQNFPSLRNQLIVQKSIRASFKELKGKGKLHLGSIAKPVMILSKQQRLNPWGKRTIISEQIVTKKGLLNLAHMGILSKQYDCIDLLNNKYELIPQKQKQKQVPLNTQKDAFMTNPALMDAYYQVQQKNQYDEQKQREKIEKKAIKRRSATKKKVIKEQQKVQFIIEDQVRLTVLNFHIDKNDVYQQYVKRLKRNGLYHLFKIYQKRIEQFAQRHGFKKFTILPKLNETKKLTQHDILNSIVNHKLLGMDMKVKGQRPIQILKWLVIMKVEKIRFKHLKIAISRIEKVKNKFKMKRVYREMINKRWKFVNFKYGSFAQNQRRLIEDNIKINKKPEVQIHILASNSSPHQLQTYYKQNQRKKVQLTRLYNNESDHIILILNQEEDLQNWLEDIQTLPSSWKKPKIHVFFSSMNQSNVQQSANIYFGLTKHQILQIKKICEGKTTVIIPYQITIYLPKICQSFGVNLFAGTFTEQSKAILFQEDQQQEIGKSPQNEDAKFKKLTLQSKDLNSYYSQKLKQIQLANEIFQSKSKAKQLFQSLKMPTPVSISIEDMNECDFFRQFVKIILTYKQYSKWVLKLPDSNFSRGLAFLQTESLKIIKDTKKKAFLLEQDINQITKIMEQILIQKIYLPHQSLMNGDQFVSLFKKRQGYIQSVLENHLTVCIFGRIQINGVFTLLGSCKKYYAENICFGALYPAEQVNSQMINHISNATRKLYQLGVFGYISFQILLNQKTKDYYFIDLIPHLDQYSSFYFYYKRMLDINELDNSFANTINRYIFYCPFIDNNGNKFKTIKDLQDRLQEKKLKFDQPNLQGFKYLYLNHDVPTVVSLVSFSQEESSAVKYCLDALKFLVQNGGQFNKFDKKYKNNQTDGLYIMDIIWKMRQIKKEVDK